MPLYKEREREKEKRMPTHPWRNEAMGWGAGGKVASGKREKIKEFTNKFQ